MAKKKRTTSQRLSVDLDESVSITSRIMKFVNRYRNWVYGSLAGMIVIMMGIVGIRYYSALSQERAYALFEQGLETAQKKALQKDDKSADQMRIDDFDEVLAKYAGTEAAKLTFISYGDYQYGNGNYDEAIKLYQQALSAFDRDLPMKALVANSIAYCYEAKKDYKTASEYLLIIVDSENRMLKDLAHFNLARTYEAMGEATDALTHYDKIIMEYPQSIYFQTAQDKIDGLKALVTDSS